MKEVILLKNGEIVLKGLNRNNFEDIMVKNIRNRLKLIGKCTITKAQSTIFIEPDDNDFDFEEGLDAISKIFGIAAFSRAAAVEKDMDTIISSAVEYLGGSLSNVKTFKVESKRADKKFPFTSPQISASVGGALLKKYHHLKVDVHNPDAIVMVEIRDKAAYIHCGQIKGAGGLPVGTAGKAAILISGGIDSPVAAYMMAKRGLMLEAIHFASPPYTSERAELKVRKLLSKVAKYSGRINFALVPFTKIQELIAERCPEEYFTLVMRRFMMRIAQGLAENKGSLALITGESLGQVASQTLPALACTEGVIDMPILRPLIGMDKNEIIKISREIDTFDISIEPYEDCCTVFTPKHPKTKPTPEQCALAEEALDIDALVKEAIENTVYSYID